MMELLFVVTLMVASVDLISLESNNFKTASKRDSVCFGDLGCFSTDPPFTTSSRPLAVVPESPDKEQNMYLLYTRETGSTSENLDARHPETAKSAWPSFKNRPTKILIHGFLDTPTLTSYWHDMRDELLKQGDYNVIIVDWSKANLPPYDQASANARVVGAQISELIKHLVSLEDVPPANFHLIGHSLGAQVSGYAGERTPGLGRITGLDPAGPYFDNTDKLVRLDETDAVFVDVIHSDAKNLLQLGLGTINEVGHMDFYPNLGHDQPGCTRDPIINILDNGLIEGIEDTLACSHVRSLRYFTESINSQCPFLGFPCASEDDFKNNLCHTCTAEGCAPMGFHADSHKPKDGQRVKYYLTTGPTKPFCQYHLSVTVKLSDGVGETEQGKMKLTVIGDRSASSTITFPSDSDSMTFTPGKTYHLSILVPNDIGNVTSVAFSWDLVTSIFDPLHWDILGLRHPKVYVHEIDVYRDEEGVDVHVCSSSQESVETGSSIQISSKC